MNREREQLREVRQQLADDVLRRIALRYKNCEVHIYPDLPELTPVEGVLRCAQEEGFILTNSLAAAPVEPRLLLKLRDLVVELQKHSNDHIHGESEIKRTAAAVEGVIADRLNALLAQPAPPPIAQTEVCGMCGDFLTGKTCTSCGGRVVEGKRYEVGYNKPIHGDWGLQYERVLDTDDLEEARTEIRRQKALGHTRGLLLYDTVEKIICVQPDADGDMP